MRGHCMHRRKVVRQEEGGQNSTRTVDILNGKSLFLIGRVKWMASAVCKKPHRFWFRNGTPVFILAVWPTKSFSSARFAQFLDETYRARLLPSCNVLLCFLRLIMSLMTATQQRHHSIIQTVGGMSQKKSTICCE